MMVPFETAGGAGLPALRRLSRSLTLWLSLLLLLFLLLPLVLASLFASAERERERLMLTTIGDDGQLIGQALAPRLRGLAVAEFPRLPAELARFGNDRRRIRLLFKPTAASDPGGFFFVAAMPVVTVADLAEERRLLVELGLLQRLATSCAGDLPLSEPVLIPGVTGGLLTAITPILAPAGCWAVLVLADPRDLPGLADPRSYWLRPESRLALLLYIAMAVTASGILWAVRASLKALTRTAARAVAAPGAFAETVTIPELQPMAQAFDRMVTRLGQAAMTLRQAAEDNAHALKAPIAVMRQALAPLQQPDRLPAERQAAALAALDMSLDRMEGLVRAALRLDQATADSLEPIRTPLDLSALIDGFAADSQMMLKPGGLLLVSEIEPGLVIQAAAESIEIILENLVENAASFSPEDGQIDISLRREAPDGAVLTVADQGPGVASDRLERIFERYVSERPATGEPAVHFGIGLWLVRQQVNALGGSVTASNRPAGGLIVTVRLPLHAEPSAITDRSSAA